MLKKLRTIFKRPFVMLSSKLDVIGTSQDFPPASVIFCWGNMQAIHSKLKKSWHDWDAVCLSWQSCCPAHCLSLSEAVQCPWWGLKRTSELWLFDQSCLFPSWKPLDTVFGLGQGSTLTAVINSLCFKCQCEPHVAAFFFLSHCSPRQTSLLLLFISFIQSLSIF